MRVRISGSGALSNRSWFERLDRLDGLALLRGADALRVVDVRHRIAERADLHALKLAGQDAGRPLARGNRLHAAAAAGRDHDHEARQVLRLRSEAVEQPRAEARPARQDRPVVHDLVRRVVVDLLAVHRADDAQLVGHAADVREDLRHLLPGLAVPLERELRREAHQLLALQLRQLLPLRERLRHRLAVHRGQLRLVVERLEVRRPAGLVQEDDALGLRGVMQRVDRCRARPPAPPGRPRSASGRTGIAAPAAPNPAIPRPRNVRRQMSVWFMIHQS